MSNTNDTERRGVELVTPLLQQWAGHDGRYAFIDTKMMANRERRQRTLGDIVLPLADGETVCIEIKTEEQYTGNLFIESWSNRVAGDKQRKGWIDTLDTDFILFVFLDRQCAFKMSFGRLREWFTYERESSRYRERQVKRSIDGAQPNKTWGFPIPIADMLGPVGIECFEIAEGEWQRVEFGRLERVALHGM